MIKGIAYGTEKAHWEYRFEAEDEEDLYAQLENLSPQNVEWVDEYYDFEPDEIVKE